MRNWRQLKVGDKVTCSNRLNDETFRASVARVPKEFQDGSGSHATSAMFTPAKVWVVREGEDHDPVPWTVDLVEPSA